MAQDDQQGYRHWQTSIQERFEMLELQHRLSRANPIDWEYL
jgi:hypothetical protein